MNKLAKPHYQENFYLSLTEFLLHAKQQGYIAVSSEFGLTRV